MSKCKYCGIEIVDDAVKCPLCSGILDGSKAEGHTYPDVVSNVRKISFLYRLFCFICIVVASVSMALNVWLTPTLRWGEIVACTLAYLLWLGYVIIKDNAGYRIRIISGVAGAVLLVIVIDTLLGCVAIGNHFDGYCTGNTDVNQSEKLAELFDFASGYGVDWHCTIDVSSYGNCDTSTGIGYCILCDVVYVPGVYDFRRKNSRK